MNRSMECSQMLLETDNRVEKEKCESICLSDTLAQLKSGIYDLISLICVMVLFLAAWVVL